MLGVKLLQLLRSVLFQVFFDHRLVEFIGFTLLDMDGVLRAVSETGPEAVA